MLHGVSGNTESGRNFPSYTTWHNCIMDGHHLALKNQLLATTRKSIFDLMTADLILYDQAYFPGYKGRMEA